MNGKRKSRGIILWRMLMLLNVSIIAAVLFLAACKSPDCHYHFAGGGRNIAARGYFNAKKYDKKVLQSKFTIVAEDDDFDEAINSFWAYWMRGPCSNPSFNMKDGDTGEGAFKVVTHDEFYKAIEEKEKNCPGCIDSIWIRE